MTALDDLDEAKTLGRYLPYDVIHVDMLQWTDPVYVHSDYWLAWQLNDNKSKR